MNGVRRQREAILLPIVIAAVAVVAFLLYSRQIGEQARQHVAAEDVARAAMTQLLEAQAAYHARHQRYGTLDELLAAKRVDGLRPDTFPDGQALRTTHYRFDILLPQRRSADGFVWIAPPDRAAPNRLLTQQHFAVVARPLGPDMIGFRVYYGDETGEVWFSEGVSDEPGRKKNPLPARHLTAGPEVKGDVLAWIRESEFRPR
jgi:hypothetical protein